MAATIFGINEIHPQPGFVASQSEQGGWVANHEFAVRAENFTTEQSKFIKGELLSSLDPDIPSPFSDFLKISEVEISRVEGDIIFIKVTATGSNIDQYQGDDLGDAALPTYTLTGQLSDVPFSKHRKWKDMNDIEKTLLGMMLDGLLTYDINDGILYGNNDTNARVPCILQFGEGEEAYNARQFALRIQQGQTTYQKSVYTWEESSEGVLSLTPQQLNKLGLISVPRGDPPDATEGRDWMLTNVSQSQTGELYRTNIEWTLSEEGGHDEFLYSPKENIG